MHIPDSTARLRFRRFTEDDFPIVHALHSDPAVMHHIKPVETEAESRQKLAEIIQVYSAQPGQGYFAAEFIPTGEFVGWFMIRQTEQDPEVEVGYRLCEAFWGKGLATEGTLSLLQHGFMALGQEQLMAIVRPEHGASRRVLEKVGFTLIGHISAYGIDNLCRYVLPRAEWQP